MKTKLAGVTFDNNLEDGGRNRQEILAEFMNSNRHIFTADLIYTTYNGEFAIKVREYIENKGRNHNVIFMIDEMGQYIGNDSGLMLNLQTIVERLGVECGGRAWVFVTSQEAIETVSKNVNNKDFSKIQGRFSIRISLSSSNSILPFTILNSEK